MRSCSPGEGEGSRWRQGAREDLQGSRHRTKGNGFWQPISQFCNLQEICFKGNMKAKKEYTSYRKHFLPKTTKQKTNQNPIPPFFFFLCRWLHFASHSQTRTGSQTGSDSSSIEDRLPPLGSWHLYRVPLCIFIVPGEKMILEKQKQNKMKNPGRDNLPRTDCPRPL